MKAENFIKETSRALGIDVVGISSDYDKEKIRRILQERSAEGQELEFEEGDIELRTSPEKLLAGYRSIVAIAISYKSNVEKERKKPLKLPSGIVSKTARGVDYHIVLREKAEKLVEAIKKEYGGDCYIGVDTTPLLDREIAYSAGIGYFGKNTSIINTEFGSNIFLGYILTELALEGDELVGGDCGDCNLCVRACPTSAIRGDYTMVPKRCVSYLTQTKEKIPLELREKMGSKVYGCDTCQNVCPKNKRARVGDSRNFEPTILGDYIDLESFSDMSNKEFKKVYGPTASGWRGKNVLKRNAIIAMGNSGDARFIETLKEMMNSSSSMIREYAMWSLLKLDTEKSRDYILRGGYLDEDSLKIEYRRICEYLERER